MGYVATLLKPGRGRPPNRRHARLVRKGLVVFSIRFGSCRREFLLGIAQIPRLALMVVAVCWAAVPGVATAADKVPIGGGAAIVVNGEDACTLTAIGNDKQGNLVGFTSAHCGGPGAPVAAEGAPAAGTLGVMVAGNDALDYAVIKFDPAKVAPVNNYNGFRIDGIGPDPAFGQIACKLGRTTGYSCGVTWGPGEQPGTILSQVCGRPGDSGAPMTVNNILVGMIHGAFSEELPTCVIKYIPLHTPAVAESFSAVLADLNAKGRPGAGFVPVA
jgi:hypothetical protein